MLLHGPQDSSGSNIEHLNQTIITSSYHELAVFSELGRARDILEARNCLHNLACFGCIYQYAGRCRDCIAMWFGRGEVDVSDRSGVLDEEGMAKGVEVSRMRVDRRGCAWCTR